MPSRELDSIGDSSDAVGPVLEVGEVANAVVLAIKKVHAEVAVRDRGSYLRVLVPRRCRLRRADVEAELGRPFVLPADLERIMPSFKGTMEINREEVTWTLRM